MYADDLILLSISLTQLQQLIDLCAIELDECGLSVNVRKTACIRIGPRFEAPLADIVLNGANLKWKKEIRYLGIFILSGRCFKINLQPSKQKFFRATNAILGKIISTKNPNVTLSLMHSFCVHILFYGLESISLKQAMRNSLDFVYNSIFVKMFNIKENLSISLCQLYMGYIPASALRDLKILNFQNSILKNENTLTYRINKLLPDYDSLDISKKYVSDNWQVFGFASHNLRKKIVLNYFNDKYDINYSTGRYFNQLYRLSNFLYSLFFNCLFILFTYFCFLHCL